MSQGGTRLRSAVLVDAENMFLGLQAIDPLAANAFVTNPNRWMQWLSKLVYPQVSGNLERNVLVRACYLNPSQGAPWRQAFVHAGFQVIDCPTLTGAGKNAADIQMVIAMLDLLTHPTHFDEIIVMSSDADFTPALTRIRAHDRRTVVIASGSHAPVLPASCDHLVSATVFIRKALSDQPAALTAQVVAGPAAPVNRAEPPAKKAPAKKASVKKTPAEKAATAKQAAATKQVPATEPPATTVPVKTAKKTTAKKTTAKKTPGSKAAARKAAPATSESGLSDAARARASEAVRALVAGSPEPVPLASVATPVRSMLGPDLGPSWGGAKGLKKFLQQLDLDGLEVSDVGPSYVYDPARHQRPVSPG